MAKFAEVIENERIIVGHLRDIHPLLDYDASESQSRFDRNRPIRTIWLLCKTLISIYYAAVARSLCGS